MKKKRRQLVISVILLLILSVVTFFLMRKQTGNTFASEENDFSIKDTLSIGKITITDQDQNQVRLVKKDSATWSLNEKYTARIDKVALILKTVYSIKTRSQAPQAAHEVLLRNMSVSYKKVEYATEDGSPIKTWYVGHPTPNSEGSYMLLETPKHGKGEIPYITYIPGFIGELTSRFFTLEADWRNSEVFAYKPQEIASVKILDNDAPTESFDLKVPKDNVFELYNYSGNRVKGFDTVAIRQYLVNFKKIHYETLNKGVLSKMQEDSLIRATPYYIVKVTDRNGHKKKVSIYHKTNPGVDQIGNPLDPEIKWDPERAFILLPSGEFAVIQFYSFDKILWPISAFKPVL
jgi:hypothetical protein